jgi:hypothetical protein
MLLRKICEKGNYARREIWITTEFTSWRGFGDLSPPNRTFLCIFNSRMLLQILGMGTLMVVPLEVIDLMMVILSSSIPVWLVDSMLRQDIVAHHSSPLCCPSHFGSLQISLLF